MKMMRRVGIALLTLLSAPGALAQTGQNSLPVERMRIPIDNTGFGTTEGGGIADHLEFQGGYIANYTLNPLVLNGPDGRVDALLAHRFAGNLVATVGLFDYVSLGVDMPMTLLQLPGGDAALREQLGIGDTTLGGWGDLRLVPKIRILRDDRHFVSLAVLPAFTLPTSLGFNFANGFGVDYGGSYLGEGPLGFGFQPEVILSTNQFGVRASGNLAWRLRRQVQFFDVVPVTPDITYRFGLGYDVAWLLKELVQFDYIPSLLFYGEVFGATTDLNPFGLRHLIFPAQNAAEQKEFEQERRLNNHLEWSMGVRYNVILGIHVEAGIGSGLMNGYGAPDLRVYGGLRYAFERFDRDEDGINDDKDQCPDEPEDKDNFDDTDGCPDNDNDNDGLPDGTDSCPDQAEDVDGYEDADGCPEADNDADGVLDADDRCPTEPGALQTQGCPISDRDQDGIQDAQDACPDEQGPADRNGCPITDRDNDGVIDVEDVCPDTPGLPDRQGCPLPDRDKDGIEDDKDTCPDVQGPVERQGCPLNDKDLDGVLDENDKCPDKKGPADREGCPIPDKDGDGVEDSVDKCPTKAGPRALEGCPDKDGDGVTDKKDKCPDVAGQAQFEGCGDKDHDGIPDNKDKCPDEPEIINGVKDTDGCPDRGRVLVVVTKQKIEIKDKVFFATGKSTIRRKSFSLLKQVALVLKANPEITKVRIEGHTDSQGDDASNKKLSQSRADAVKIYLMKRDIDPARLDTAGFGEEQPIADNGTPEGRAENRRVEFVIVEQKEKVTTSEVKDPAPPEAPSPAPTPAPAKTPKTP